MYSEFGLIVEMFMTVQTQELRLFATLDSQVPAKVVT